MVKVVGIGDMIISNNIEDRIKTFALASCVGIVAYSSTDKVGGLLHIALPKPVKMESVVSGNCYYATTGLPYFINKMCVMYGCRKSELTIRLYGGADSIRTNDVFNIGRKNIDIVYSILDGMDLKIASADIGRNISRTIELDINTGKVNTWKQNIII